MPSTKHDYLFAGAGASATLLLMCMDNQGLLHNKKIIILDPDLKSLMRKTFCFWGKSDEMPASFCQHLIRNEWEKVRVNQNSPESIFPQKYFHIAGVDLYHELQRIINKNNIQLLETPVSSIQADSNGVEVNTPQVNLRTTKVFDSRTPRFLPTERGEVHLLQSFIGFVIEIDQKINTDCIDLMDFDVDQQGSTQFMYTLPFQSQQLLVELTRFGHIPITAEEAHPILEKYIQKKYGQFRIVETEVGCIPMSNATIEKVHLPGVISIGGRSGAIKPSTGYAFKNMSIQAQKIAESLHNEKSIPSTRRSPRFQFYDRLLLLILSREPHLGRPIFKALFQKKKAGEILNFLDEKTNVWQDLRILLTLPVVPFLKVWYWDAKSKMKFLHAPFLLFVLSFLLIGLQTFIPEIYGQVESFLFVGGLLVVGIPHGALDNIVASGNFNETIRLSFVLSYLAKAIAYLLLWFVSPNLALVLFLIYSIWHFGQCDMNEWQPNLKNRIKNWSWGSILLGILLLGHISETNRVLQNLETSQIILHPEQGLSISWTLIVLAMLWGIWDKNKGMILSIGILALSLQLPLIAAFGLYFIGQHSRNGWSHLKQKFNTDNISLYKKALPFTGAAFALFLILILFQRTDRLGVFQGQELAAFFVFVSCISFPHVLTMNRFYQNHSDS